MNFTQEIKRELLRRLPAEEAGLCLLAGVLDASGKLTPEGFRFTSENESTAGHLLTLVEGLFGAQMTLTDASYDPKHGKDKLTFSLSGDYLEKIGEALKNPGEGELCAYVKGVFLGGGSCTLPRSGTKTGYHLEFTISREKTEQFAGALDRLDLIYGVMERGERAVIYIKSREAISDFLALIGAENSLEKFNEVSAAREENNAENRVINCSSGNADRSAIASVEQVRAFTKLKESGMLSRLPKALQDAAQARLKQPSLSLGELAASLGLTKSGLNHRFRKLIALSRLAAPDGGAVTRSSQD